MNVLLLLAHSIAEYDDLRMLTDLGYDAWSIGAYSDPANPGDTMRPALPEAAQHPELVKLLIEQREKHAGQDESWAIDWAKADLHPGIIDWADVIIAHHYLDRWIVPQWDRLKHKRVIWRTCGQSDPRLEALMAPLRADGLQIVRYSPKEVVIPNYAGCDALIRFGKYPADYGPWSGSGEWVGNVTQHMLQRGEACGLSFWQAATRGLPARPAGPGSESMGGPGALTYDEMRQYLADCRAYLYTGTVPAPYTLGLIEAMLTGTPVVSIGPGAWYGPPDLFEAHEIVSDPDMIGHRSYDYPQHAQTVLHGLLNVGADSAVVRLISAESRQRATDLFSVETVGPQWQAVLG